MTEQFDLFEKPKKKKMGRSEKIINWKKVDELLLAGCTGVQIAPHFNIHVNTLYRKVEEEFGVSFTEYSALKKDEGDSLLLKKQFEKALGGDNVMLIWLGKNRMQQSDSGNQNNLKDESKTDIENSLMLAKAMLSKYKEKYGDIDEFVSDEPEAGSELPGIDTQI
jgi:hypothetical protein